MKKSLLFVMFAVVFMATTAATYYSFTVRYHNSDSRSYTFSAKMSGSTTKVTFGSSRTASTTIQGSGKTAIISCGCGDVEVSQGDRVEIKNGCIRVFKC